jgi:uncharacterized protein (TIGR00645 family)
MSETKQVGRAMGRNLSRAMLYAARWIMAPIYLGLLLSLLLLAEKSIQKLIMAVPDLLSASSGDTILTVLTLVDLSLVGNLVVIVLFSGWENFVGRLFTRRQDDQLEWVGNLDFSAVKLKLIASVAAIAAIQMLETFVHIDQTDKVDAMWQLAILLGIGVTGVLLALMDRLSAAHGQ